MMLLSTGTLRFSSVRRTLQCGALLLFAAAAAHANLLTNGSFEAVDASASPFFIRSAGNTPGWTHTADGVDLIHNDYEQATLPVLLNASHGVQFLDMNQMGALGGIYQIVSATAGSMYRLRLDTSAWVTNGRGGTVAFDLYDPGTNANLDSGSFTDSVGGTWYEQELNGVALSNQIGVRIYGVAAPQAGMGVDNVRLEAVPEPATVWLLSLGGAALVALKRRRPVR